MEGWSDLPQHIFEDIVKDFSWQQLKALSVVCHNWNTLIDLFWFKRVELQCSSVNTHILEQSRRNYIHLNITSRVNISKTLKIIQILKDRGNSIKSLIIKQQKILNVVEILKAAGKDLIDVKIIFKDNEKANSPPIEIEGLKSVKTLFVYDPCDKFEQISAGFTSLKKLTFLTTGNGSNVESLINANRKSLEDVDIQFDETYKKTSLSFLGEIENPKSLSVASKGEYFDLDPNFLQTSWELISLSLIHCSLTNQDLIYILQNFQSLRHLALGFDSSSTIEPETIRQVWNLPNLESLEIPKFEVTPDYSIINTISTSVTRLSLKNVRVNFDFARFFHIRAPNLEVFQMTDKNFRQHLRFELVDKCSRIQTMKTLHLNLSFDFVHPTKFTHLQELSLGKYCNEGTIEWANLKVPNLQTLKLNACCSWDNDLLEKCLVSCANVKNLQIKFFQNSCRRTVEIISNNLQNLEELKMGYMTWELLLNLLKKRSQMNLKRIEMDFSNIDFFCLNDGMIEEISVILKSPVRLCDSEDNVHFGDNYVLVGDLIDIKLSVLPEREDSFN